MAIQWGPRIASANNPRMGIELTYSPSSVNANTTSVTVTAKYYTDALYATADEQTLNRTGEITGSQNFQNNGGTILIATNTKVVNLSFTSTQTLSFGAYLSGHYAGLSPSVTASITIPRRPYYSPTAPSNLDVVRASDNQQNLYWDNNPSSSAPYTGVEIDRYDTTSGKWSRIATVGAANTSYADKSTQFNRRYEYRVRAKNNVGVSGWNNSARISTTPMQAQDVVAKKDVADIDLTWYNNSQVGGNIEVWHAANGVWDGTRLALLSGYSKDTRLPNTYTHLSPDPAQTHKYRIRHYEADGNLYSAYSPESNTIQLQAPPLAPYSLIPFTVVDASGPVTTYWTHNPVDGTAQTAYEVEYRRVGDTVWGTSGKTPFGADENNQGQWVSNNIDNTTDWEWRVRTWGQHANPSPYSAIALLQTSTKPTATIQNTAETISQSTITVNWSYFDAEGSTQTGWRATLYSDWGVVLESKEGVGTTSSYTFKHRLSNEVSYLIGVRVRDGDGLWSDITTYQFTVAYNKPPTPILSGTFEPETGSVVIEVSNPGHLTTEEPTATNSVYRSNDPTTISLYNEVLNALPGTEQAAWDAFNSYWEQTAELIAENMPPNSAVKDHLPNLGVENLYRVTAFSALPSSNDSDVLVLLTEPTRGWVFLNGGTNFSEMVRLRADMTIKEGFSRAQTTNRYVGRKYPVKTAGEAREHTISISARVRPTSRPTASSSSDEVQALADLPGIVCFRDPLGHKYYVTITEVTPSYHSISERIDVEMTRVDYTS